MEQQPGATQAQARDDVRSLWIGDLQYWMDESYLKSCFPQSTIVSTKVIRNKITGHHEGYGFVEFESHAAAEKALQSFTGAVMPRTEQAFRLNWACVGGDKRDSGADDSIFVGDLAADVTDAMLLETFKSRYPSVKSAKVVMDVNSGRCRGYGFVRFGDETEKSSAMTEMHGVYCSSRPMRIRTATPKKQTQQHPVQRVSYQLVPAYAMPAPAGEDDFTNTTIFVGGLDQNVSLDDLKDVFSPYGEIKYTKIPPGRGCGFVQFMTRASAEEALKQVHGSVIGQQTVRLSWGRHPANKQRLSSSALPWYQPPFDSQWNAFYPYNHSQAPYAYLYPQDPALVYTTGYQVYGQQVN
ncbi:polyadenylate-binding protein RBP47 [Selaginella moellendorffii]|uniref:polyadenylate-binding protein RBP47 n=1 Tax=Selaginella moellendorffii TaxID=88036 RepID=UPI000D1D11E5|nr:polyadenylate-binding protein RBP47 [Selaginella moellendorffii]|eukprot:XP_024521576.1 polyadenylate-binding protein RBP47 [Selaginella moellendorffii]